MAEQWFSNLSTHRNLQSLIKTRLLGSTPKLLTRWVCGWGLRICISKRFPGDVDVTGENQILRTTVVG